MENSFNFTVKRSKEDTKALLYSARRELLDIVSRDEQAELTQEILLLSSMIKEL